VEVYVSKRVKRKVRRFPAHIRDLDKFYADLRDFPNIRLDIKKLGRQAYRVRKGDYRVLFVVEENKILIYKIEIRESVYE